MGVLDFAAGDVVGGTAAGDVAGGNMAGDRGSESSGGGDLNDGLEEIIAMSN